MPPAVETQSSNHWTAREVPYISIIWKKKRTCKLHKTETLQGVAARVESCSRMQNLHYHLGVHLVSFSPITQVSCLVQMLTSLLRALILLFSNEAHNCQNPVGRNGAQEPVNFSLDYYTYCLLFYQPRSSEPSYQKFPFLCRVGYGPAIYGSVSAHGPCPFSWEVAELQFQSIRR